jgi:D-alanyl-lipoteichoic acid acyltransferase DltB (MBOAT superfamily)
MHFHSPFFVLVFLPAAIAGFFLIGRANRITPALLWLLLVSLVFFITASGKHLWVLALSVAVNYGGARTLARFSCAGGKLRSGILFATVIGNIGLLAAFKIQLSPWFSNIPVESSFAAVSGGATLIPLGLSFITFQQIGYIVDVYKRRTQPGGFLDYALFVTFFPQMVMGPIVRFRDLAPQFRRPGILRPDRDNLAAGLIIFACGFFKKAVIADQLAPIVDNVFNAAAAGTPIYPADAALAAVAFQFQLYFDFSAYSDMAIGMARMFNIHLPINFYHPFRATDRFDVWRRWHLTFVAFMREYVFHPMVKRLGWSAPVAIMATALLSGLWHGLGWGFVLWGMLTGILLLLRHYWVIYTRRAGLGKIWRLPKGMSIAATFTITVAMGVLFRSGNSAVAGRVFLAPFYDVPAGSSLTLDAIALVGLCAVIIWTMPNLQEMMGDYWRAQDVRPKREIDSISATQWQSRLLRYAPGLCWGVLTGVLLAAALLEQGETTRYLYYQF